MKRLNTSDKFAFTLAEVLITLAIIGVVAAVVMPTLIQNHKKHVYVNKLKQSYAILTNLTQMIMADEGVDDFSNTLFYNDFYRLRFENGANADSDEYAQFIKDNLSKYLKFSIYKCKGDEDPNCKTNYLNGISFVYAANNYPILELANGISMTLLPIQVDYSEKTSTLPNTECLYSVVDVNGFHKGPNIMGRDKFIFWFGCSGKWYPQNSKDYARLHSENNSAYWANDVNAFCSLSTGKWHRGEGCAARIMDEGWKMNY